MFALARSIKNKVVVRLMGAFLLAFIMAFSVIQALNEMSAASSTQLTERISTTSRSQTRASTPKPSSSSAPKYESSRCSTRSYVPVSPKGQAINDWFFSSSPSRSRLSNKNKKSNSNKSDRSRGGRAEMGGGGRDVSRAVVRSLSSDSYESDSSLPSSVDSDNNSRSPSPSSSPAARHVRARRLTMRDGRAVVIDIY